MYGDRSFSPMLEGRTVRAKSPCRWLTQSCQRSKGRAVRSESTLFLIRDNLASSHWSGWRGEVHKRHRGPDARQ